jgi:hypothetical protein
MGRSLPPIPGYLENLGNVLKVFNITNMIIYLSQLSRVSCLGSGSATEAMVYLDSLEAFSGARPFGGNVASAI